ncbi:MAG TPA: SIR2 family protein [Thermoanaerobaculia bacterium]|nr:SIR2 family protein [Thermoanaerobaculia bacterium]
MPRLDDLRDLIHGGNAIAFIGAGVSRYVDYPSWTDLLKQLAQAATGTGDLPLTNDAPWNAEMIRTLFEPQTKYYDSLRTIFAPKTTSHEVVDRLVSLPFRHFITTNYDDSLERADAQRGSAPITIEWNDETRVRDFITNIATLDRRFFHVHGWHEAPEAIVLSERDYAARYVDSGAAQRKLFAIFATQRIVFFGFSLSDVDFVEILRIASHTLGRGKPRHFAVLPLSDPKNEKSTRQWLNQKYDIEPVFFDPKNNYAEFIDIIRQLSGEIIESKAFPGGPDEGDPHRGQFGGSPTANGRTLTAIVTPLDNTWFSIQLVVASTDGKPIDGKVFFHLHPTFVPSVVEGHNAAGIAEYKLIAWGTFTVGVTFEKEPTQLELDLAMADGATEEFRSR